MWGDISLQFDLHFSNNKQCWASFHVFISHLRDTGSIPGSGRFPGEGRGNPLQYSCLENHMDRWAWQPTVHRVTKSWTQLKWLSTLVICVSSLEKCLFNSFAHLIKKKMFFNWRKLLYRILLFSAKYQHESTIGIPMSPPSWTSLPFSPHSTPLGWYWAPIWVTWVIQQNWLSILHMVI